MGPFSGAARRGVQKAAKIIDELVLKPIEPPVHACLWEDGDGNKYDTAALAAKSLELLKEQGVSHT
jgi:hypothetical protein